MDDELSLIRGEYSLPHGRLTERHFQSIRSTLDGRTSEETSTRATINIDDILRDLIPHCEKVSESMIMEQRKKVLHLRDYMWCCSPNGDTVYSMRTNAMFGVDMTREVYWDVDCCAERKAVHLWFLAQAALSIPLWDAIQYEVLPRMRLEFLVRRFDDSIFSLVVIGINRQHDKLFKEIVMKCRDVIRSTALMYTPVHYWEDNLPMTESNLLLFLDNHFRDILASIEKLAERHEE